MTPHRAVTFALMNIMVLRGQLSLRRMKAMARDPMKVNERLLKKIIRSNRGTVFGKAHHFDQIHSLADYRRNVPPSAYEDYADDIERTKKGEKNVLTSKRILGYSRTSGSSGVPKYIPATKASLKSYVNYTWTRALALGAAELKRQGKRYHPGRGLFLSPATNDRLPDGRLCSNIAEIGAERYGAVYPYVLALPQRRLFDVNDGDYVYSVYRFGLSDPSVTFVFSVFFSLNVAQIAYLKQNWRMIVDDIEKGSIDPRVDMKPDLRRALERRLKPMPERAEYLRRQFEQGFDETLFPRIWPNLTFVSAIGNASFKPAAELTRSVIGSVPFDFSIYGASEALIACCYRLECTDMQLLADSCFYEFVEYGGDQNRFLTLDQLEQGKRYEILITNQAGLYRYRLKDVIEVRGWRDRCPLIAFSFRKGQLFNIAGEKFSEEDARNTVEMLERAHGVHIDHWLFYQDDSIAPSRYVLAVESEADLDWDACIDELEDYMGQCNKRYPSQRSKQFISRLIIRRQLPGTHDAWKRMLIAQGAPAGQVKPVHSLDNDQKREFFLGRLAQETR